MSYDFINKKNMSVYYRQFGDVYYYRKYGNEDSPFLRCKIGKNLIEYTNFIENEEFELVYREKKAIVIAGRQITVFELSPYDTEENVTHDFPQSIYFTAQNGILGYTYSDSVEYLIVNPIFK